ncbi:trypsin-like peptidase domain-containing protein, partial [Sphaerotilus sp.]|uniref:trypsin-like peptidase domain-containing protein n=1 Tax=Sphaerotilus sp. TaxID=2093942 RepID=UPI0034E2773A
MPEFNVRHASRRWLVAGAALITSVGLTATLVSHRDATAQSSLAATTSAAQAATGAPLVRGLPDFADLVEQVGPAVVNIRTSTKVAASTAQGPQGGGAPDAEMQEFFRRFFGIPIPRQQDPRRGQPQQPPDEGEGDGSGSAPRGVGSGFIVAADGLVMTNAHVVDGADEVVVRLTDKREFKAKVVGADKRTDVAVLKIEATGL